MYSIPQLLSKIARGQKGNRPLAFDEAEWIFKKILKGDISQIQLGAFLAAQRVKEETDDELNGFIKAARGDIEGYGEFCAPPGAVDLPCYAGKRRSAPLHLAAAIKAKERGIPVVIHGSSTIDGRISALDALEETSVQKATSLSEALPILKGEGIVQLDIADISPGLDTILQIKKVLGIRTFANTIARILNPLKCDGLLSAVSHTPYVEKLCRINHENGQTRSFVFMSLEGEPELHMKAGKNMALQSAENFQTVAINGMENAHQPNPQMKTELIIERFKAILAGDTTVEEQYVLARMAEAFDWASTGNLPDGWNMEPLKGA